ncbi:MAG: hypothetical protein CL558_09015 [Alphaproteobacteria bacterium]|nr:hypothetical protein [Alphaproteobacteria bacterium]MAS46750.1 hypothetical protein [Alphaproteobacteria bacterium]MAX94845.1 hypothetical protein [Alphaproteobacteria bacterium]MBN53702.1 hypothetical protein [Alphaproteobacteria bacterium]OUT41679.1 MAG: hypothetical protein CBB62_04970 [Micavibrio sp. TMED2]
MVQAFKVPITDELTRLSLNYINPILSMHEVDFKARLRMANGPEGIANGFEVKVPKIDEASLIGTKKSSDKKIDDYTQSRAKKVTHLLVNVKAIGDATLLGCKPTSGRQPLIDVSREGNELSFFIPYNEETNARAWEILGSIGDVLNDIEADLDQMLPEIRQDMARRTQKQIDEIDLEKSIAASITFPLREG